MSEYNSWRAILEDYRLEYLTEDEAREYLEELSYELTEDELEEAEEKLEEFIRQKEEDSGLIDWVGCEPLRHPDPDDYYGESTLDSDWEREYENTDDYE